MPTLHHVLETLLFATEHPLSFTHLQAILSDFPGFTTEDLHHELANIAEKYESSGIELKQLSAGYLFQTRIEYAPWVQKLWQEKPRKYSKAVLEVLAIIACEQPITRGEIEAKRGVGLATNVLRTLLEREWIEVVGHKQTLGRPALYGTTQAFLTYFNIDCIEELTKMLTEGE